jgi:2-oxoisovalerate dehydrogenase E2 component (dihydrolipoyl transacylase)
MANVHVIKVPDVGEGIAEVELVAWHVKPGDVVAEDQGLADVMTDKASVEIPSPVAGRVLALGGEVGRMLAVGSELIRIELSATTVEGAKEAREAPAIRAVEETAQEAKAAVPVPARSGLTVQAPLPQPMPGGGPLRAVAAAAAASGPAPTAASSRPTMATGSAGDGARPIASPALRRRAWELGIDLRDVVPTGTAGRITQADLDAAAAARTAGAPQAAPAPSAGAVPAPVGRDDKQAIPVIGLRRRIALQMQEAKRRVPHFSYVEECDVTELEALRATLNAQWGVARGHLTLLPLLARAVVLALAEHPQVNARFDDEAGVITRYGAVHLGVATQTSHGLLVPVIRHAETLNLWGIATELTRLADSARAGRTTRSELSGSTITISSLGALGGIVSTPIINRPEVAIVGVNRMVEKPVVRGGAIVVRQTMNLSSSFDHRVIDGADAAQFIQAVRRRIEQPALLFVG